MRILKKWFGVYALNKSIALAAMLFVSGCSTYQVKDTYIPVGENISSLSYTGESMDLYIYIMPETMFYSVGMFGMPVIPTVSKAAPSNEIILWVRLSLRQEHNFSVALQPCFVDLSLNRICPDEVKVSAWAVFPDSEDIRKNQPIQWDRIWRPGYKQLREFSHKEDFMLKLTSVESGARIDRSSIYQRYSYSGDTKWDYFTANFAYHYKCKEACPQILEINTTDLVLVDNSSISTGRHRFERQRVKKYDPLMPIQ